MNKKVKRDMREIFIILLAIILILLMCIYLLLEAISSDNLELDMEIEKEMRENYEKFKKDTHLWF